MAAALNRLPASHCFSTTRRMPRACGGFSRFRDGGTRGEIRNPSGIMPPGVWFKQMMAPATSDNRDRHATEIPTLNTPAPPRKDPR